MHTVVIPKVQLVGTYGSETSAGQGRLYVYWKEALPTVVSSISMTADRRCYGRFRPNRSAQRQFPHRCFARYSRSDLRNAAQSEQVQSNTAADLHPRIATGRATASVTEQYLQRAITQDTLPHQSRDEFNIQLGRTTSFHDKIAAITQGMRQNSTSGLPKQCRQCVALPTNTF